MSDPALVASVSQKGRLLSHTADASNGIASSLKQLMERSGEFSVQSSSGRAADIHISLPQDFLAALDRHVLAALGNALDLVSSAYVCVSVATANGNKHVSSWLAVVVRNGADHDRHRRAHTQIAS